MRPRFQLRHQDYVLGPNQDSRLSSVAAGQMITGIELPMDNDAPFLERGRAYRVAYADTTRAQAGLNGVSARFSGPLRDFRSQGFIPLNLVMPYGGQGGAWRWHRRAILRPAGSIIQMDLVNTGAVTLTNLTFYFRGVKLFPFGINPAHTYPPQGFRCLPFVYPIAPVTSTNPYGVIQNVGVSQTLVLQQFQCQNDAHFVFRFGQAGPSFSPFAYEMAFILRDENQKSFSNDFVHYETLFGPSLGSYPCGGTSINAVGTGNASPSVMFPELYIEKSHLLYYDFQRTDSAIVGAQTVPSFPVNLIGSKVYPR